MRGADLTEKQLKAAEQYILLRRASDNKLTPHAEQVIQQRWKDVVMLVAEYGALRANSVAHGGSVEEPGEIVLTGQVEKAEDHS